MIRFISTLWLVAASAIFQGCGTIIARQVNTKPPDPTADQLNAIENSAKALDKVNAASVYVGTATVDVEAGLRDSLEKNGHFTVNVSGLAHPANVDTVLEDLAVQTAEQDIRVKISYKVSVDSPKVEFRLRATAHVLPYVSTDPTTRSITLTPQALLTHAVVDRVRTPHFPSNLIKLVMNAILAFSLPAVNSELSHQTVSLQTVDLPAISPDTLFKDKPAGMQISGSTVVITPVVDSVGLLVDSSGIHGLGDLTAIPRTGQQVGILATPADASFAELKAKFLLLAGNIDVQEDDFWRTTGLAISKTFLARLVSRTATSLNICGQYAPPDAGPFHFDDRLKFGDRRDIGCGLIANRSCTSNRPCDQDRSCDPGWPCPDCPCSVDWSGVHGCDPSCPARRLACEIDKGRYRAQCEAEKSAARAACEAGKEAERLACEADKGIKLTACNAWQKLVDSVADTDYANVSGDLTFQKASAALCINNLIFDDDLGHASLATHLNGSAHLDANILFQPLNLGYLACLGTFGGPVAADASIPDQTFELRSDVVFRDENGLAEVRYTSSASQPVAVDVDPAPALILLGQLPQTFVVCPLSLPALGPAVLLSPKFREDMMRRRYDVPVPSFTSRHPVPDITIDFGKHPTSLHPEWLARSVRFKKSH